MFLQQFKPYRFFKDVSLDPFKPKAYIFLAADYGNLGDIALTYAHVQLIRDHGVYQPVKIPVFHTIEGLRFVRKRITKNDIITTTGGGNMGDIYPQLEFIRQIVISFFPHNKIISFPQTIFYSNTALGQHELIRAQKCYNKHTMLHLFARDKTSYETMKKHFHEVNVYLTPDIVLSMDQVLPKMNRKGAVICMRNDLEKRITDAERLSIIDMVNNRFESLEFHDTHLNRNPDSSSEREQELFKILDKFRNAELVITDRLHGMIFCHITNTPCLVFQNFNHKIAEAYDWIKENKSITLMSEFSSVSIQEFLGRNNFYTDITFNLKEKYLPIFSLLNTSE